MFYIALNKIVFTVHHLYLVLTIILFLSHYDHNNNCIEFLETFIMRLTTN